jgi:hypothetical protein
VPSSAPDFPFGGGGGREAVLPDGGISGEATEAALAAFALAIADAVDTTGFCTRTVAGAGAGTGL